MAEAQRLYRQGIKPLYCASVSTGFLFASEIKALLPLLLLFSLFILLRGHNEPGGGFIGGLIGATGFVVYAIACGTDAARRALRVAPEKVAMAGLGIPYSDGIVGADAGQSFEHLERIAGRNRLRRVATA